MARKVKIDNAIVKRLVRKKQHEERIAGTRNPRTYYLIFCEGIKTEPNYFTAFSEELPKGTVTIDIVGTGANTTSLVEQAKDYCRSKCYGFDQKWVVFDKDDFSLDQFNQAIQNAQNEGFRVAYSNEAFELWYLLHFEYCDTGIQRHRYIKKLTKYLGNKYKKNDPTIYKQLLKKGDQARAIRWAQMLYDLYDHTSPANENPSTCVHFLVTELNKHKHLLQNCTME